ncbi:hypothetical protein [Thiolapillus sp.]|uniref:hypothetical protein n=1 Tax=Thiolapillus sp. TaxID=2017437 RepID=UPI003AF55A34
MTRTAGAQIGCQRPSRFWGLGCPKIYHEIEDTLDGVLPGSSAIPRELIGESPFLEPVRKALVTLEKHAERVVRRWASTYTHARMGV